MESYHFWERTKKKVRDRITGFFGEDEPLGAGTVRPESEIQRKILTVPGGPPDERYPLRGEILRYLPEEEYPGRRALGAERSGAELSGPDLSNEMINLFPEQIIPSLDYICEKGDIISLERIIRKYGEDLLTKPDPSASEFPSSPIGQRCADIAAINNQPEILFYLDSKGYLPTGKGIIKTMERAETVLDSIRFLFSPEILPKLEIDPKTQISFYDLTRKGNTELIRIFLDSGILSEDIFNGSLDGNDLEIFKRYIEKKIDTSPWFEQEMIDQSQNLFDRSVKEGSSDVARWIFEKYQEATKEKLECCKDDIYDLAVMHHGVKFILWAISDFNIIPTLRQIDIIINPAKQAMSRFRYQVPNEPFSDEDITLLEKLLSLGISPSIQGLDNLLLYGYLNRLDFLCGFFNIDYIPTNDIINEILRKSPSISQKASVKWIHDKMLQKGLITDEATTTSITTSTTTS